MDKLNQFKLYDRILKYAESQVINGKIAGSAFGVLKTQLKKEGVTFNQFDKALQYLVGTNHLAEKYGNYTLESLGRERILNSFESEYLEKESDKKLHRENLDAVTEVAKLERRFIPKTMTLSIVSIVISVITIINSYVLFFLDNEKEVSNKDCYCHYYDKNNKGSLSRRIIRSEKPIKKSFHDSIK